MVLGGGGGGGAPGDLCACFHVYDFVNFNCVRHQSCNPQQISKQFVSISKVKIIRRNIIFIIDVNIAKDIGWHNKRIKALMIF